MATKKTLQIWKGGELAENCVGGKDHALQSRNGGTNPFNNATTEREKDEAYLAQAWGKNELFNLRFAALRKKGYAESNLNGMVRRIIGTMAHKRIAKEKCWM